MKLSIIVPVFNEKDTIEEILKRVESVILPLEKEVVVVDDCSNDGTKDILRKIKKAHQFILKEHSKNQGKGDAIKTGLGIISGDIVLIQDADLEYDPKDYNLLIQPFLKEEAEAVYGSRILKKNPHSTELYFLGGRLLTLLFNFIYGAKITDINTGYKVIKKDVLLGLNLKEKRFAFCEEVTAKLVKKGITIKEVPINYYPRNFSKGKKIRWWRDGFRSVWAMLKNRF